MLSLFLSAAVASDRTQTAETYWELWTNWHKSGERWLPEILTMDEHSSRFGIFKDNVDRITRHNEQGLSWTMGVTPFADMTPQEFKTKVVTSVCEDDFAANAKLNAAKEKLRKGRRRAVTEGNPASIDWSHPANGVQVVTAVKNQQSCGSCWAFSTTGAIEGAYAISTGTLNSLSEQELVDCDTVDNGCNGGAMQNGFQFAENNGGLCKESDYQYTATDGTCKKSSCKAVDPVKGYNNVSKGESYLESAVAKGPVSVAIEADQMSFQLYTSGVFKGDCGTGLDHGVLAVGYGTDATDGDYWIVKNSWGEGWGMDGYIRICKNCDKNGSSGQCGIASDASYPTV